MTKNVVIISLKQMLETNTIRIEVCIDLSLGNSPSLHDKCLHTSVSNSVRIRVCVFLH